MRPVVFIEPLKGGGGISSQLNSTKCVLGICDTIIGKVIIYLDSVCFCERRFVSKYFNHLNFGG